MILRNADTLHVQVRISTQHRLYFVHECTLIPAYAIKAYGGSRRTAPPILNHCARWSSAVAFIFRLPASRQTAPRYHSVCSSVAPTTDLDVLELEQISCFLCETECHSCVVQFVEQSLYWQSYSGFPLHSRTLSEYFQAKSKRLRGVTQPRLSYTWQFCTRQVPPKLSRKKRNLGCTTGLKTAVVKHRTVKSK